MCYIYLNLGATPILEGDPEIWHQKGEADENSNLRGDLKFKKRVEQFSFIKNFIFH